MTTIQSPGEAFARLLREFCGDELRDTDFVDLPSFTDHVLPLVKGNRQPPIRVVAGVPQQAQRTEYAAHLAHSGASIQERSPEIALTTTKRDWIIMDPPRVESRFRPTLFGKGPSSTVTGVVRLDSRRFRALTVALWPRPVGEVIARLQGAAPCRHRHVAAVSRQRWPRRRSRGVIRRDSSHRLPHGIVHADKPRRVCRERQRLGALPYAVARRISALAGRILRGRRGILHHRPEAGHARRPGAHRGHAGGRRSRDAPARQGQLGRLAIAHRSDGVYVAHAGGRPPLDGLARHHRRRCDAHHHPHDATRRAQVRRPAAAIRHSDEVLRAHARRAVYRRGHGASFAAAETPEQRQMLRDELPEELTHSIETIERTRGVMQLIGSSERIV
ncbi:hypothetical protein U1Q18_051972 [Sarracenia purpurea var. burkii]